jgi:hypothetical protein
VADYLNHRPTFIAAACGLSLFLRTIVQQCVKDGERSTEGIN